MKASNQSYTLFIDESGIADLTDYNYRQFLLTGVTIPNSELDEVSGYFTFVKRKYSLPEGVPFHTYDLLENPQKKLSTDKAKQFVNSMCEFIDLIPLSITGIYSDKGLFRKSFKVTEDTLKGSKEAKDRRGLIYYLSAFKQLEIFTSFLKGKDRLGYIHADSRTYQDMDLLQAFWDTKQTRKRGGLKNNLYQETRKRLVSITFAEKSALSSGVQIADFISFVIFAHNRRKMSDFKDIRLGKVWDAVKNKKDFHNVELISLVGKEEIKRYF